MKENSALAAGRRRQHLAVITICGGVLLLASLMTIEGNQAVRLPFCQRPLPSLCTFRRATGLPCAGCGLTRCFISLCHGQWQAAWSYNAAGIGFFCIVAAQIPLRIGQMIRLQRGLEEWPLGRLGAWLLVAVCLLMVAQWLTRL